jgi:hypothetical protein
MWQKAPISLMFRVYVSLLKLYFILEPEPEFRTII